MQKKDLPKQQRRKRKDPQSRDFKCKCGKSYLSYAAVYTHVKNKHDGDKQFQDTIIKPQKQKLKRGRPKDKKQIIISSQTQTLSICQEATLLIYQKLKENKEKFTHNLILEGNQEMNQSDFNKQYQTHTSKFPLKINLLNPQKIEDSSDQQDARIFQKFMQGVIKHFTAQIAAKVAYVVNFYAQLHSQFNIQDENQMEPHVNSLNILNIWKGQNQINTILYDEMIKWLGVIRKNENQVQDEQ